MSNQKLSLANKYRPQTFSEVSEQDSVRIVLENQIRTNNLKHVYLFCGGAGTGKTTTARIVANMMNERKCKPIEIDCASRNGVDDMRLIQEECNTRPLQGKYKIFILDECFTGNTLVRTEKGLTQIKDIQIGQKVYTSTGLHTVINKSVKQVPNSRLCYVKLSNGKLITTTVDHLFMTTNGWIEAQNLQQGDELIVYNKLQELWKEYKNFEERKITLNSNTELNVTTTDLPNNNVAYYIQKKPLLHKENINSRCGWENPLFETWYTKIYKNNKSNEVVKVAGVQQFSGENGYTEMYDLNIEENHSYFVEDVLVHNCHMISTAGWNSMLKIFEEPPEYVIFVLCTTDPQKIIPTIMSRAQRFNFSKISTQGIINRLTYILQQEQITTYEPQAISYIARLAKGGMRDAITNLEKCLDFNNNLTLENVLKVTSGGVTEQVMLEFMATILYKDSSKALNQLEDIYATGIDMTLFIKLYTEFVENCVKYLITKNTNILTISDLVVNWLEQNKQYFTQIRDQLGTLLNIRTIYNTEDIKILIESWIIQICS